MRAILGRNNFPVKPKLYGLIHKTVPGIRLWEQIYGDRPLRDFELSDSRWRVRQTC